jgi:hypothetical protein
MTDGSTIRLAVVISIALVILFLMMTTLVLPFFRSSYETGWGTTPVQRGGTGLINSYCSTPSATLIACTDCNTTAGYTTFLSSCSSLISATNDTHCYQCSSFGFKTVSQGLLLFVLVIGMIFFGIVFLKATKFGKK